jgi:methyl-accepting chemotaxis protein
MLNNIGIRGKFLLTVSMTTVVLLSVIALVIISMTNRALLRQADSFINHMKAEQTQEEKVLHEALKGKVDAITALMVQTGAGLIVGYDYDTLKRVAEISSQDQDIESVTFFRQDGKALTPAYENTEKAEVEVIRQELTYNKEPVGTVEIVVNYALVNKSLSEISSRINSLNSEAQEANGKQIRRIVVEIIIAAVVGILLLCAVIYFVASRIMVNPINHISQRLAASANQVSSQSNQVTHTSHSLADGASEQASSIEETSSSLEEMSAMIRQNADNANQADNLMKEASQVVQQANSSMTALTASMKEISGASEETSKIIKTIDEIAFQTNLLALNAAVEAARAGEAGAGFAVVADEVRNLAIRAADAAKNTEALIEGTVKKTKDGTELVVETNKAFSEMATSTAKVNELVSEIAGASNEQAQGIEQVNKAVAAMDKVINQTAASAEESASVSEEMNDQAGKMKVIVDGLVSLVGKSGNSAGDGHVLAQQISHAPTDRTHEVPAKRATGKDLPHSKAKEVRPPEQVIPMDLDEVR